MTHQETKEGESPVVQHRTTRVIRRRLYRGGGDLSPPKGRAPPFIRNHKLTTDYDIDARLGSLALFCSSHPPPRLLMTSRRSSRVTVTVGGDLKLVRNGVERFFKTKYIHFGIRGFYFQISFKLHALDCPDTILCDC